MPQRRAALQTTRGRAGHPQRVQSQAARPGAAGRPAGKRAPPGRHVRAASQVRHRAARARGRGAALSTRRAADCCRARLWPPHTPTPFVACAVLCLLQAALGAAPRAALAQAAPRGVPAPGTAARRSRCACAPPCGDLWPAEPVAAPAPRCVASEPSTKFFLPVSVDSTPTPDRDLGLLAHAGARPPDHVHIWRGARL